MGKESSNKKIKSSIKKSISSIKKSTSSAPQSTSNTEKSISKKKSTSSTSKTTSSTSKISSSTSTSSTVYLGRIPHGFYEHEMRSYFTQFGTIDKLRLSRNKRTGKSKHYAFIKFTSPEVARIVCDTMNNYLLFGSLLKCHVVEKEHEDIWKGANKSFKPEDYLQRVRKQFNREKSEEERETVQTRLREREQQKMEKLKALGINYEIASYFKSK